MNAARLSDGLLPAEHTLVLCDLLKRRDASVFEEQLLRDLAATTSISWSRARNTIVRLASFGIVSRSTDGRIKLAVDETTDMRSLIADRITDEVVDRLVRGLAWACVRLQSNGTITIDGMTLPAMEDGLSMWITEFRIASRERTESRHWSVAPQYLDAFISGARRANSGRPKRAKSADELLAELARQAEYGKAAEEWVLQFERGRLMGHPLRDQICRVSEEDVAAGYDIASFATVSSLQHDRFVEVKSHGETKLFHWSRNEIATAREFGEDYALYLVDRTKMMEPAYEPHVIVGPTPEMFDRPGSGWRVEATSFEHVAV